MSTTPDRGLLATDGVALAGLTAFGYVCAYLYELGYADHFRIPAALISLDLSSLLLMAILGLLSFLLASGALCLVASSLEHRNEWAGLLLERYWSLVIALAFSFHMGSSSRNGVVALIGLVVGLEIALPFFFGSESSYRRRFVARQSRLGKPGYLGRAVGLSDHAFFILLLSLAVLAFGSFEIGRDSARAKEVFLVDATNGELVLGIYGSYAVLATRESETGPVVIGSGRRLRPLADLAEIDYSNIGRPWILRPEEVAP